MASLIGNKPNQVPTNGDLGKLAFMDVVDTVSNNPYYDTAISDVQPTLNLDFVNSKTLDPRITFARSTTATYYDAKSSAVAEQNLLTYSQDYSNVIWAKGTVSLVTIVAPDGNSTATQVTANSTNAQLYQQVLPVQAGTFTVSFWAKRITGTGTISIINANSTLTTITLTGSWQQFSATSTVTSTGNYAGVQIATSGDVIGFVFPQLEQRSSATAYNATTTAAVTNYIPTLQTAAANVARLDYNPVTRVPNGLLIEEQRTNLTTYSSVLNSGGWNIGNITFNATANIAPDGTQTANQFIASSTTSDVGTRNTGALQSVSTTYTFSCYAKYGTAPFLLLRNIAIANGDAWFNIQTGTLGSKQAGVTSQTITPVGNGWYRCSITGTTSGTIANNLLDIRIASTDNVNSCTAGQYAFLWGAQLEAGAFPTSYIPTVASQVTRSADAASMTGTNFSSWYNIGQGTLYSQMNWSSNGVQTGTTPVSFALVNAGSTNTVTDYFTSYNQPRALVASSNNGSYVVNITAQAASSPYKTAFALQTGSISAASQGSLFATNNTSTLSGDLTTLWIGRTPLAGAYSNICIAKLTYFPARLPNAEIQELTS